MTLPEPFSWDRAKARAGKFDGKFLVGVMTTGIYCLPSCTARQPKPANVRILPGETEAQALCLRACKRCRPDLFYRGEDGDLQLFEGLVARVRAKPQSFADATQLASAGGVSLTKLGTLFRDHAHLAPAAWLRRERVSAAQRLLLDGPARILDIGHKAGFESESVFHRQFLTLTRMTPGAYRALSGTSVFLLHLPVGYRAEEILSYHGRDPESLCEKREGNRLWKALETTEGPVVLEIAFESDVAWCRAYAAHRLSVETMAFLHRAAMRMLGLIHEVVPFETRALREPRMAFVARRKGLRVPSLPTGFDSLCWAITGQQINLKFAASLRRDFIALAGKPAPLGMRTHPSSERVAELDSSTLTTRRFSRSKANYLTNAAQKVAGHQLDVETLSEGSAVAAEKKLTALHGVGTWTARYVMLRNGFADSAPVGDSALATALHRLHGTAERPRHDEVDRMMQQFAPYRSLATAHLWASLKDAA